MWTAEQCAERAGVALNTWRSYVSRGQAPKPTGYDPSTGLQVWQPEEVQHWLDNRPGAGSRTSPRAIARAQNRNAGERDVAAD